MEWREKTSAFFKNNKPYHRHSKNDKTDNVLDFILLLVYIWQAFMHSILLFFSSEHLTLFLKEQLSISFQPTYYNWIMVDIWVKKQLGNNILVWQTYGQLIWEVERKKADCKDNHISVISSIPNYFFCQLGNHGAVLIAQYM